ncbi:hypothetical protein GGR55DRAFT_666000 [Xylaria sp. FL0064]|nr:hypothetical protein GGR55DRAFT_666000 [Xylaria sp. FL0064]
MLPSWQAASPIKLVDASTIAHIREHSNCTPTAESHFLYLIVNTPSLTNMLSVSVEPPSQVQRGTVLYPPVVVSCPSNQSSFFQAVLMDSHGAVAAQEILQGMPSVSPQSVATNTQSSRGSKEYGVFSNLVIGRSGRYALRVDAYYMDYESGQAVHVASVATREIRVRSEGVAAEQACKS